MDNTRIPFGAYKGPGPYIFVSYAHKDSDRVFPIISEFHKAGFPIWYDEGIDPGNEWSEEIENKVLNCSLFIVLISPAAVESKNVRQEIKLALSENKPFIHIWLEDTTLKYGLKLQMSITQGIMYFRMEKEPENFYRKCLQSFDNFGIQRTKTQAEAGKAPPPQAEADYRRGRDYAEGRGVTKDYAEAVRRFRKAAEQGHAGAQNSLGFAYWDGQGVTKDRAEAARWYRKAAEQGHAQAQYMLGSAYLRGAGVAEDFAEAVIWYRKAAEQGHAQAQEWMGFAYSEEGRLAQNYAESAKWYRKAAEQGDAYAQYSLGKAYANGQGVAQNYAEAVIWYRKAAEQGHADANKNLAVLKQKGLI
jgi:hypothetical protein